MNPGISVSASDIAKYFIWKAISEGRAITNKKLQKLLYYAQAWSMVYDKKPLFKEDIEAWIHGPAIKSVYNKYKIFGFSSINENIKESEIKDVPSRDLLESIWTTYGKYDAQYLEQLTHNEEPWQKARQNLESSDSSNNVISLSDMQNYYGKVLKEVSAKA